MWILLAGVLAAAEVDKPPYPQSPVIQGAVFDFASREHRAPGSDNWPTTWADDGNLYTCWGDGGGFGGTNSDGRVSLGVARITGSPEDYEGHNVWGGKEAEAAAQFEGKSYGILCVNGTLYMWVLPGSGTDNYLEARLAWSFDHGRTWARADWAFTYEDEVMSPTFLQFGRDYAGARDGYVYMYATRLHDKEMDTQRPGLIDLLRVPKGQVRERDSYECFAGFEQDGEPIWGKSLSERRPVWRDPNGSRHISVCYNAGLGRYLLCTEHGAARTGNLGIFDAEEPWGPWTTVACYENWGGLGSTFYWNFPTKWFEDEGRRFALVYTGTDDNDAWNMVRGSFIEGAPDE